MPDTNVNSVEFLRNAANALAGMTGAQRDRTNQPRLVWLERVAAQAVTAQQLSAALQALPAPVHGWWQTADHLVIASHQLSYPAADSSDWAELLQGEWTAGPQTIQVKRVGNVLRLARLTEHAQPHDQAQAMLATDHAQVPRKDFAQTMAVTTYAQWSDVQAQVVPVAQRLQHLQPLETLNTSAQEAA